MISKFNLFITFVWVAVASALDYSRLKLAERDRNITTSRAANEMILVLGKHDETWKPPILINNKGLDITTCIMLQPFL